MTGKMIKLRRKQLGMNAETLAAKCGISPATIYRYESGDIENMGIDKLTPIAAALCTTPAYLMGWEDEAPAPEPISADEQTLLSLFRSLNGEGQEKLLDYADDLAQSGKYIKTPADGVREA